MEARLMENPMWTLERLREKDIPLVCIKGQWVPSRPLFGTWIPVIVRLRDAWAVFRGKADAFTWPKGQ